MVEVMLGIEDRCRTPELVGGYLTPGTEVSPRVIRIMYRERSALAAFSGAISETRKSGFLSLSCPSRNYQFCVGLFVVDYITTLPSCVVGNLLEESSTTTPKPETTYGERSAAQKQQVAALYRMDRKRNRRVYGRH